MPKKDDNTLLIAFAVSFILLFFLTGIVLAMIISSIVYMLLTIRKNPSDMIKVGTSIIAVITFVFIGFSLYTVLLMPISFYLWMAVFGIIIAIYAFTAVVVAKHYSVPLVSKLSEITPRTICLLEIVYPGIGFTYMGKQKGRNYTFIGLFLFSSFLIGAFILISTHFANNFTVYSYNFLFRVITPIAAYITVKNLKSKH
jgi:hypothetical protein